MDILEKVVIPEKHVRQVFDTLARLIKTADHATEIERSNLIKNSLGDLSRFEPAPEEKPTVPPEPHGLERGESEFD
ncbi:MAG: hypothetical protein WC531_03820 [Candidatus Paceibacterota bacterium]|jgi:hypothetical protein